MVGLDMDMTRSFYAKGLRELGLGKERSIKELEPQLITLLTRLKQRYAKIDTAVTLMQKEYGVPE
ncbi:MAG: hypothetical protein GY757_07915 [bacterium]|nr:hypothetical protein [bacterium]